MLSLKEQIDEVLATLSEREQKVIRLRFGLDDGQRRTLKEVGSLLPNQVYGGLGVGKERARQIEAKALRRLRHPSRSKKLESRNEVPLSPEAKLLNAIFGD